LSRFRGLKQERIIYRRGVCGLLRMVNSRPPYFPNNKRADNRCRQEPFKRIGKTGYFPPVGQRSQKAGQAGALLGIPRLRPV
jgi:hypothetical protein